MFEVLTKNIHFFKNYRFFSVDLMNNKWIKYGIFDKKFMFTKQENQDLKREFWIDFAKKYPRKWLLYDTKIKDLSFKFFVDNTKAQVQIAIEHRSDDKRFSYFDQFLSLKNILEKEFISDLVFQKNLTLENGKTISLIWVEKLNISVSNRKYWDEIFDFFNQKMDLFEQFYFEYDEVIKNID